MPCFLRYGLILIIIYILSIDTTQAQTCNINSDSFTCLGNSIAFSITSNPNNPNGYSWDFGDGQQSNLSNPVNLYTKSGFYTVKCSLTFSNGTSCFCSKKIRIYNTPLANFIIDPSSNFCFYNNIICIKDLSTKSSDSIDLKKRIILWGDGGADFDTSYNSAKNYTCHQYNQKGMFAIDMEITDINGCSKKFNQKIYIKEDIIAQLKIDTLFNYCDSAYLCFTDQSLTQHGQSKRTWLIHSSNKTDTNKSICIMFYSNKIDSLTLFAENDSGCIDTVGISLLLPTIPFNFKTEIKPQDDCYSSGIIKVKIPKSINGLTSYNTFFYDDKNSPLKPQPTLINSDAFYEYFLLTKTNGVGKFYATQTYKIGNCTKSSAPDSFEIFGPILLENNFRIANDNQCEAGKDPVFVCINGDKTKGKNLKYTIDFGDKNCSQCTSWVSNNWPSNNCRWSHDSTANHIYYNNGCYEVKTIVEDTIRHCIDSNISYVWIGPPKAKPLKKIHNNSCAGTLFTFTFDDSDPQKPCRPYNWYVNFDSACKKDSFIPKKDLIKDANGNPIMRYFSPCSKDGNITVGLVIQTGGGPRYVSCDTNPQGNLASCFDTVWMHNWFKIFSIDARFEYYPKSICNNETVKFWVKDSIKDSALFASWDFGDTIIYDTLSPPWVIKKQEHKFKNKGRFPVIFSITDRNGCSDYIYHYVDVGHFGNFYVKDTIVCPGTPITFYDDVWYWSSVNKFSYNDSEYLWKYPQRNEKLYWHFGDGQTDTGSRPTHTYTKEGVYYPYLISVDSNSCIDTFWLKSPIYIIHFKANFYKKKEKFLCGEFVQLFDSSYAIGLKNINNLDSAVWWDWDFGDGKRHSNLKDPFHNYTSYGWFKIKLIVKNTKNCIDSIEKLIYVKGPIPSFEIVSDSIGCVSLTVRLKNSSIDSTCSRYIWLMGDSNHTTISTQNDSDILFTYNKPGVYDIYLFGEDSIYNPDTKNYYYCTSIFPDTNYMLKKRVIVLPYLSVDMQVPDTVCPNTSFILHDLSDTSYKYFRVLWGDGLFDSTNNKTITHSYSKPGLYNIYYFPGTIVTKNYDTCYETKSKTIFVSNIKAGFDIDNSHLKDLGLTQMIQKSQNAVKYSWDFGVPNNSNNNSSESNPTHDYSKDTGFYTICLVAYNSLNCSDTVCKNIYIPSPNLLNVPNTFTANNDQINDAFDIEIKGEDYYKLYIYNRWGELVFIGDEDGENNDGKNWNGSVFNTGNISPEGTYYFLFSYKFKNEKIYNSLKGFITLIR